MVPPTLQAGDDFSEGLADVLTADGKRGYINKSGELVFRIDCDLNFEFSDGLAIVITSIH